MKGNISEPIDDSAARWAARTLSGVMRPEEKTALAGWLEADPRHRLAFDSYIEITELSSEAHDVAAAAALERELEVFAHERSSRWSWLVAAPAMAASIAAAALFFGAMTNSQPAPEPERYATARGETAVITLRDGSAISLNTDSVLEVSYSNEERSVSLSRGEALFDVTRDAKRPFVVLSPTAEARVLGTRFNVKATGERTIVSVLSGVVEVDAVKESAYRAADVAVTLIAGQETVFTPDSNRKDVRTFNPDAVTSWLRGKAVYENQPLLAVITDLNRYYTAEFVLGDDSLGGIPVTGGFDLKDQAITVEALEIALSLRAEKNAAGQIVLLPNG